MFINVAESMLIFGPIDQLGCFSASAGRAPEHRLPGPVAERAAGRGQDDALDILDPVGAERLEDGVVLGIDRQDLDPGPRRASATKRSPAQTRHSLLASATREPARIAASVGDRPAAPTMPATTTSTGRAAASSTAAAPAAASMPLPGERVLEDVVAGPVGDHGDLRPDLPRDAGEAFGVAERRHRLDLEVLGMFGDTASVLVPIEPVAPRMEILRRGARCRGRRRRRRRRLAHSQPPP